MQRCGVMIWILLATALVACKQGESKKAPEPTPAPVAPKQVQPRPQLPELAPEGSGSAPAPAAGSAGVQSVQDAFASEPVDPQWRDTTEKELHKRLARLPGDPTQIECKTTQCKLTIAGNQQDVAKAIDELATESSLRGVARTMHLTEPHTGSDGKVTLAIYAQFERYQDRSKP